MEKEVYKLVNWKQGMSVSSSHFVAMENYFLERIMQCFSFSLDDFSYGVVSPIRPDSKSQNIVIEGRGEHTRVELHSYFGITRGGALICIDKAVGISCLCNADEAVPEDGWNVVLTVLPYERNPSGEPNMLENPPRYPFVVPSYRLNLMARLKNVSDDYGPNSVVVGLVRKKDEAFVVDENYIPPTLTMAANEQLSKMHLRFKNYLKDIQVALRSILQKALEQPNKTVLVNNIILVSKEILRVISDFYFTWINKDLALTPYQVVEMVNRVANAFIVALSFISRQEREALLLYFKEWNGLAPSTFEQMLSEAVGRSYNHNRIGESMFMVECVLKNIQELFEPLSRMDQIGGRRKEEMVICFSDNQSDASKNRDSWLTYK